MKVNNEMIIIADGKEELVKVIFTFEKAGKKYFIFEFQDSKEISAAQYVPGQKGGEGQIFDIETDEEWDIVDDAYEQYLDSVEAFDDAD